MKKAAVCLFLTLSPAKLPAATGYLVHNLVADAKTTATADFYDPRLINPWGNATSAASPFWVCDLGLSTLYSANSTGTAVLGTPNANTQPTIPPGKTGSCTGIIANTAPAAAAGTPPNFPVTVPTKAPCRGVSSL